MQTNNSLGNALAIAPELRCDLVLRRPSLLWPSLLLSVLLVVKPPMTRAQELESGRADDFVASLQRDGRLLSAAQHFRLSDIVVRD